MNPNLSITQATSKTVIQTDLDVVAAQRCGTAQDGAASVMRRGTLNSGCTEIMSPWGDAINESEAFG